MSQLTLIRHGQSAAYSEEGDALTELGKRQALRLGEFFAARGVRFDEVYTGSLKRQIETERIVGEAMRAAGHAWPEAERLPGYDEYDASSINQKLMPALAQRDESFARLVEDFRKHAQAPDRNRYFQRMFERLMDSWLAGATADGVEAFEAFHARVEQAHRRVLEAEGSRRVAVFTSGGPIGVCVQLLVQAPKNMALHLNWRVRNGSLTEITFSGLKRTSLDSFNATPHLEPELESFR